MYRYILLVTILICSNTFASDRLEDVKRSYDREMMREYKLLSPELASSLISALKEVLLPTKSTFSITEDQREQLLLLKEEIGASLQEHEDFCGFIKRNGLTSKIAKETYKDYFHYNRYKCYSDKVHDDQWGYFTILQDKITEREFTYFCYQVVDNFIKNGDRISNESVDTFLKELEVGLNQNAHTIKETVETFFRFSYPGLLVVEGTSLGLSLNGAMKYEHEISSNPQANWLFTLLYNYLSKMENYSLELFEYRIMKAIKDNSHIITHVPILSAFNSTQLYLNIYKTVSRIFHKESSENIFGRMVYNTENTSSAYMRMLNGNLEGKIHSIFGRLISKKERVTAQEFKLLNNYQGKKLDSLLNARLTIDENNIQQYVLNIFPEPTSQTKLTQVKATDFSPQSEKSDFPLISSTDQQVTKSCKPTLTKSLKIRENEIIVTPITPSTISTTLTLPLTSIIEPSSDIDSEIEFSREEKSDHEFDIWDYEEWYRENVLKFIIANPSPIVTNIQNTNQLNRSNWSHKGNLFFEVVLGYCTYQPLVLQHFNSFLKDANGAKLKMTQRGYIQIKYEDESVETKYALPNLTASRFRQPHCIFTVHQPHPGHEFPRRTLFEFLRYQLQKAGYQ